jgi:hypothetical protein
LSSGSQRKSARSLVTRLSTADFVTFPVGIRTPEIIITQ